MTKKIKIGLLKLESCGGCFSKLFNLEKLKNIVEHFEFIDLQKKNSATDYIFIEGCIINPAQEKIIKKLSSSKKIVMFGSCSINHFVLSDLKNSKAVSKILKGNYLVYGCPPSDEEIYDVFSNILYKKNQTKISHPVCKECSENEIKCLLLKKEQCCGYKTVGGCNMLCTRIGHPCIGCRTSLDKKSD